MDRLKKCLLLATLLTAFLIRVQAQQVFYVSTSGSDAAPGTLARPLASLEAALEGLRTTGAGDVRILLRGGTYALERTIEIDPRVLAGHRLEIGAYENEKVVLSAAKPFSPRWMDSKGPIRVAFIGKGLSMDRLFCNGRSLPMARYPNYDSAATTYHGTAADALDPAHTKRWAHPQGGYVHAMHESLWGSFDYRITGRDSTGNLTLEGGWQNNRPAHMHPKYRYVENIYEELDVPGEWFYNAGTGLLYLYPPKGVDPDKARFTHSVIDDMIRLKGDGLHPVAHVSIRGIGFMGTNRTFMLTREPLLRSDWTIYRGGAVLLTGTEDCRITDCGFTKLGGNAVFFSGYNKRDTIDGCHIRDIGASGILFIGDTAAVRSPAYSYETTIPYDRLNLTPGPRTADYPESCLAQDDLVHDIGTIEKQAAGVGIQMAAAITVSHNTIYNTPRAGINIGDGCWGGDIIEYNDVYNTVLETGDHGAFNSWGRDRYWSANRRYMDSLAVIYPSLVLLDVRQPITIRNNRFRCDHGWDIDLDDGSSNYRIYDNVCLNGGLKLREGFYRYAKNNILINNSFHPHVWFAKSGDRFEHNIVMRPYAPIGIRYWGDSVDLNLFSDSLALLAAQGNGTDRHSIAGDPWFIDAASGNYQVEPGSPAAAAGFVNFPMNDFGVIRAALKRVATPPGLPVLRTGGRKTSAAVVAFHGARLKSVEGLGERSAYGLADETGVIVVSAGTGPLARCGLMDRDVIRTVDGRPVRNVNEFLEAYDTSRKDSIPVQVIRDQRLVGKTLYR